MLRCVCPLMLLFCFLARPVAAQIYADISISEGSTPLGTFRMLLHHEAAPRPVANFIGLATGERNWISPTTGAVQIGVFYFDGLVFHRLDHDFVLQGGDPLGTGTGGPGYIFQDQFNPSLRHSGPYVVSMANSGVNSNGSQFFITLAAAPGLDDLHSIFGTVIDDASHPNSRALIDGFMSSANFPTDSGDRPITPLIIDSVVLSGPDLATFDIHDPALGLPTVDGLSLDLRRDAATGAFFLEWSSERKSDYPLYFSEDLDSWTRAANILSMDQETAAEIDVTGLFGGDRGFLNLAAVDYSHTPDLPQNILQAGDSLVFQIDGGELTILFDGKGAGTWLFEAEAGGTTSGAVDQYGPPSKTAYFSLPESGQLFPPEGVDSLARSLAAREVVVLFDGPVGPNGITAIQPQLSFHEAQSGWYNGPVNANGSLPGPFRGTFAWVPADP